jgi:hypothetical protein
MTTQRTTPKSSSRDAGEVDALVAHLIRRLSGRIRGVAIVPDTDGLILKGRVRTYYEKQLAQHVLMEATSARIVSNEIEVG